ncbi:MAG: hypothetical protein GVY19_08710 [Bacteroidetes bacterium]|jgi:hypothetical protein|nr:hypothetical protein [Bacteroidota bacterium]
MKTTKLFLLIVLAAIFSFVACEDEEEDNTINITQEDLNQATISVVDVTGNPDSSDAVVAHNGSDLPPDSTYREIFANVSDLTGDIEPGTIVTKKVFAATPAGEKDADRLYVSFAMVKREAGYDAENADWEYITMPNDADNDFTAQPNGDIDAASVGRGKLSNCIECHTKAGGGDYLFVND